jgi:hypothetical protein
MAEQRIPKNAKQLPHTRLAEGEKTGHYHDAVGDDAALYDVGGTMMLDAPKGAEVTHQEHNHITLPPGQYDRSIVQEYDHPAEEARKVQD